MATIESETFIPLNDVRKFKKQSSLGSNSDLDIASQGEEDTLEFRMQAEAGGKKISLWHDVSLVHVDPQTKQETPYLNFVCEIPKFTRYVAPQNFVSNTSNVDGWVEPLNVDGMF